MNKAKKRYDSKHKLTRIHLGDYLILKRMSQVAGVSMAEALHRLIEHQAQLPMPDMAVTPTSAFRITGQPAIQIAPVTVIAANGAGAKHNAYLIEPKGVQYG
ncbi:hypothetical protein ES705_45837 [subsurface metagenome]